MVKSWKIGWNKKTKAEKFIKEFLYIIKQGTAPPTPKFMKKQQRSVETKSEGNNSPNLKKFH